ncbi:glycosyltransferase [Hyphomicrobium sulfonivorans]|uniref:glycosyltransferase n=1 Tax=Hyphomicrobium sulfonivorans TaxID=121290 RepID=UPI0015700336|nr:glycosyltransferase [Hyphomicrobium sulfonivorans]MBI1649847.1 glycosyltransferase [Hyphomicrobium sulfonivorans]NSL71760.1 glycosyl transferase group 1 family protein [Hyphomicrobium sulfonivorans]
MKSINANSSGSTGRRVLFVIGSLDVGGAEKHVASLSIELKKRGWQPEILVLFPGGPLTSILAENGVVIHSVAASNWLMRGVSSKRLRSSIDLILSAISLFGGLWRRPPDVIHFFLPASYIIGGMISLASPVKTRIMSRRSLNNYQSKHARLAQVEHWLHPKMTRILANSRAVWNDLVAEGVDPEKLRLIYNGIDTDRFAAQGDKHALREVLGLGDDDLVLVMVANLIAYKGHRDLIEALASIKDRLPLGWVLLTVGRDDGIGPDLQELTQKHGMDANIRFLGPRSDVPDLLKVADIGLLTSHEEGFSNAVLEAMASGLPMVVTEVGGNGEAVLDGKTGFVVPARDPAQLASALLRLVQDGNRVEMGRRGQQRVRDVFSLHACVDEYERTYEDALAHRCGT